MVEDVGGRLGDWWVPPIRQRTPNGWGTRLRSCLSTLAVQGKKYKGKNRAGIGLSHPSKRRKGRAPRLAVGLRVGHPPVIRLINSLTGIAAEAHD